MKLLSTAEAFGIFLDNVKDISWLTVEIKKDIAKAMDAAYTQGLKDATALHKGEKT